MDELKRIQAWYQSHCNGDWEHTNGITIDTLDKAGWSVRIDLPDTVPSGKVFALVERKSSKDATDWVHCRVAKNAFHGTGGAGNLAELLTVFLDWAEAA